MSRSSFIPSFYARGVTENVATPTRRPTGAQPPSRPAARPPGQPSPARRPGLHPLTRVFTLLDESPRDAFLDPTRPTPVSSRADSPRGLRRTTRHPISSRGDSPRALSRVASPGGPHRHDNPARRPGTTTAAPKRLHPPTTIHNDHPQRLHPFRAALTPSVALEGAAADLTRGAGGATARHGPPAEPH